MFALLSHPLIEFLSIKKDRLGGLFLMAHLTDYSYIAVLICMPSGVAKISLSAAR